MAKDRSSHLNEVVEAIALLKIVEKEWPQGFENPLLKETFQRKQIDLQEELFQIMSQKKGRKKPEPSRKSGVKKEIQSS